MNPTDDQIEAVARAICGPDRADHDAPGYLANKPHTWKQWQLHIDTARAAIAAMAPQWQPIETAPVGGDIDVWHKDGFRVPDFWWDDGWGNKPTGENSFTHWMPLPPAPEGE